MKDKILNFIIFAFGSCFPFFIMYCYFAGCESLSELFSDIHINIPSFGFWIFGFISFGCFVSYIKYESEKRKEEQ